MKNSTKIRIRKAVSFARTLFAILSVFSFALMVCSADGPSFAFPVACFFVGVVCFAISYILDRLLFETAWKRN